MNKSKHLPKKLSVQSDKLDKHFFTHNRAKLFTALEPFSVAILASNYPIYTNADSVLPYVPNNDLWYFTGIEQDETLLVLEKLKDGDEKAVLFIKDRNPESEIWDGKLLSDIEAQELSGINEVKVIKEFKNEFKKIFYRIKHIYVNWQEHERAPFYRDRNHDLLCYIKKYYPLHNYRRLAPLIHELRLYKTSAEIKAITNASTISKTALEEIIPLIKDGVPEKHIEAGLVASYIRAGGEVAFSPIVASAVNSCTLHYITNHKKLSGGEVLLIDSGARINKYSADVTRVFPIGIAMGKGSGITKKKILPTFNKRQEQVYEAVYRILTKASAFIKPGLAIKAYREQSVEWVKEELIGLNLLTVKELKKDPLAYRKYFMHGISHWLGLDVHDVGSYERKFEVGMVLTCEPGIYILEERIGIRLENNLWLRDKNKTAIDLTAKIPLELGNLYQWMAHNF